MSGEGALHSSDAIPLPDGVRRGLPMQPAPDDAAVAEAFRAYVEASRWLSEQQAELARKAQDVVAAAYARERARIGYLAALEARDRAGTTSGQERG